MLDEVDVFRAGQIDLARLASNLRGLLGASDMHGMELEREFWDHFAEIDMELELRTEEWAPPGASSDKRLDEGLTGFREWVVHVFECSSLERE